jgi:predicted RNA-binding Zn-ribbon protein involved in translation (DUF1610 family)
MPRGVLTIAETRDEAIAQATEGFPQFRAIDAREIDLSDLPPLATGPLPKHWVVVVEHEDPDEEAKLPQDADPLEKCARETRLRYLTMAVDPQLLVTGVREEFPCPKCGETIRLDLPAPRATRYPQNTQCPHCGTPLTRTRHQLMWGVIPQRPKRESRDCIFCDQEADSYEHVVPAWISKQLHLKTFLSQTSTGGRVSPRRQPISFASHRARIFCISCNKHFKHLEDAVIPLLVPMAKGLHLVLDADSQQLLALWAMKTAMALIAATDGLEDAVPIEHRRAVRDNGEVPDAVWVGFFPWHGEPMIAGGRLASTDGTSETAYVAVLTFAGIGFSVMGFQRLTPDEAIDGDVPPFRQFWPPRSQLMEWPSLVVADRTSLPFLMNFVPLRRQ